MKFSTDEQGSHHGGRARICRMRLRASAALASPESTGAPFRKVDPKPVLLLVSAAPVPHYAGPVNGTLLLMGPHGPEIGI